MQKLSLVLIVVAALLLIACSIEGTGGTAPAGEAPSAQDMLGLGAPAEDTPLAAAEDGGGGMPVSLIILGGALLLLLVLLYFWWTGRASSNAAEHASWRDQASVAYMSGAQIHDALAVRLAGTSSQTATSQNDVDRRMSELAVQLHVLEIAPPDANEADTLQDVLGSLATLHSSVQGYVSSRDASQVDEGRLAQSSALLKRRLGEFDGSLAAFRATI